MPDRDLTNVQFPMHNSQPKWTFSQKTRNSAEWLRLRSEPLGLVRPPSVRIRIEHWELNIGQIPIGHSAKLFLRIPLAIVPELFGKAPVRRGQGRRVLRLKFKCRVQSNSRALCTPGLL